MHVLSPIRLSETRFRRPSWILLLSRTETLGDFEYIFQDCFLSSSWKKSACCEFIPPRHLMFLEHLTRRSPMSTNKNLMYTRCVYQPPCLSFYPRVILSVDCVLHLFSGRSQVTAWLVGCSPDSHKYCPMNSAWRGFVWLIRQHVIWDAWNKVSEWIFSAKNLRCILEKTFWWESIQCQRIL